MINIVIPMAGKGSRFKEAGYVFPKPLIDINGKTMIEIVTKNLTPNSDYRFIFVCQREHYEKYDLHNVLKNASMNKFEVVLIDGITQGAACTVLCASQYIDNEEELLIANSDQLIDLDINVFIEDARNKKVDGLIMTFHSSHPKWSYAKTDDSGIVTEVAEKRVISSNATVGIYYFNKGNTFVSGAQSMIKKNIRHNDEFYVCPVYNEVILSGKVVKIMEIPQEMMHGLGTPEDLKKYLGEGN